jgi:hypothetical protein
MKPVDNTLGIQSILSGSRVVRPGPTETTGRWDANPRVEAKWCVHAICLPLVLRGYTTDALLLPSGTREGDRRANAKRKNTPEDMLYLK